MKEKVLENLIEDKDQVLEEVNNSVNVIEVYDVMEVISTYFNTNGINNVKKRILIGIMKKD